MSNEDLKNRLMCLKAQSEILKSRVKSRQEGATRGSATPIEDVALIIDLPDDLPGECLPYIPGKIFPGGTGEDDLLPYWPCFSVNKVNVSRCLTENLLAVASSTGQARGQVANNSLEAADNLHGHVVGAVDAFTNRDLAGAVDNALSAVADMAQVAGHLWEGN